MSLEQVATEINTRLRLADKAEDHRLSAGVLLAQARERLPLEHPGMTWVHWCDKHIDRSFRDVQRCLQLANAPDPIEARGNEKETWRKAKTKKNPTRTTKPKTAKAHDGIPSPDDAADIKTRVRTMTSEQLSEFKGWFDAYVLTRLVKRK